MVVVPDAGPPTLEWFFTSEELRERIASSIEDEEPITVFPFLGVPMPVRGEAVKHLVTPGGALVLQLQDDEQGDQVDLTAPSYLGGSQSGDEMPGWARHALPEEEEPQSPVPQEVIDAEGGVIVPEEEGQLAEPVEEPDDEPPQDLESNYEDD